MSLTEYYLTCAFSKGVPREVTRLKKQRAAKTHERRVRATVDRRDKRRCFWIGCTEWAYHKHHKVYRSHGGKFETDNIVSGCALHHRWVHKGLIRLIGNPDTPPIDVELTALGRDAHIRIPKRKAAA